MGRIPQEVIDEVVRRSDLVGVISRYTMLKKQGNNFIGLCPFHGEKSPSFSVSPEKGVFHCFGCKEGGGLLQFLMKIENRGFAETVVKLGEEVGMKVELDDKDDPVEQHRRLLFEILERSSHFYHEFLLRSPTAREALQYLESRSITMDTIKKFRLGWAPPGGYALRQGLEKTGYKVVDGIAVGVLRERQGRVTDTLRNRVTFPIWDAQDRVVAFGGRVLDGSQPKYLNTPETELYSKRRQLYGLNLHRQSISKHDRAVVVEGYLDVIMLDQVGVDIAVASLGTSLTEEQAKVVRRYTRDVVLAYDSDKAGQSATVRGIELFEQAGLRVHIASLPAGEDPDSLARKEGHDGVAAALASSEGVVDFYMRHSESKFDLSTPEGKEDYITEVLPALQKIHDGTRQSAYVVSLANRTRIPEQKIIWKLQGRKFVERSPERTRKEEEHNSEIKLFRVCARYPELLDYTRQNLSLEVLSQERTKTLFGALFAAYKEGTEVNLQDLLPHLEEPGALHGLAELLIWEPPHSSLEDVQKLVKSIYERSDRLRLEQLRRVIVPAIEAGTLNPEDAQYQEYKRLQKQLKV